MENFVCALVFADFSENTLTTWKKSNCLVHRNNVFKLKNNSWYLITNDIKTKFEAKANNYSGDFFFTWFQWLRWSFCFFTAALIQINILCISGGMKSYAYIHEIEKNEKIDMQ